MLTVPAPKSVYIYMSRVVVIRLSPPGSVENLDHEQYRIFLESGLKNLTGIEDAKMALQKLIPSGTVGMKTNCLARKFNSTPIPLTAAMADFLKESGIDENNVIIWERTNRELEMAGFKLNASSFERRCLGTDTNGVGYSADFYISGDVNSLVSRILTEMVDHNINMPVLKDHSIAGLSAGLKNLYGTINNPNKWHGNNCDPYAAQVAALEPIRKKNRLTIIDAIKVQYNGGPGYDSRYIELYNGLIISDDPIAADRIGLEIIEYLRKKNNLPSLEKAQRPVKYLATAEKIGLGIADIAKIDLKVMMVDNQGRQKPGSLTDG